jgi:hypothetical protein
MKLRRDDACRACGTALPKGTSAYWNAEERSVTCLACRAEPAPDDPPAPELDRGRPGASAAREHRRRRANREARTRSRHPLVGGLLLAVCGPPQHERAWASGGLGEEAVGRSLERFTAKGPAVILHDRRMPRGHGNIDHLAVAPTGVFVIDAKAIKGKVRLSQPLFGKPRLIVAGRNRTRLVDGLDRQVDAVHRALVEAGRDEVPVYGVFCFTKADLPMFGAAKIRGHRLHYVRATARKLNRSGPYEREAIEQIASTLAAAFPRA